MDGERIQSFRPSAGFLRYLKFQFWILLLVIDMALLIGWFVLTVALPWLGFVLAPVTLSLIVAPDVVAYLAIHLRYDTTWYVVSDRSMRIRRGIWVIQETTITFENVQNVTVDQGPLQRFFGIADVVVQTAGGGGGGQHSQERGGLAATHHGLIEGISHAPEMRDLILSRLETSRSSGLGDEPGHATGTARGGWSPTHVAALREIRDTVRQLVEQQ
jgi:membrane protein YdbS with pleckstrin-like domain